MRILSITAGPAGMYCGSCIRDNALAREMIAQGHDVTLLPLYTPTRPDEENVSAPRIFFGGISVYLEQFAPLFRYTPRWLDKLWDSAFALRLAARGSVSNQAEDLAALTISMLRGDHGYQRKEFGKLLDWLRTQPKPDVVCLSYTLLLGLARPLKEALKCPVVCAMQGEDLFLDGLGAAKSQALALIREQARNVDALIAVSEYYGEYMAGYLGLPAEKIHVAPLGISLDGYPERRGNPDSRTTPNEKFTVGYFARVAHEKGLHLLAEAYRILRRERGLPESRLLVAGYLGPESREYLAGIDKHMSEAGLSAEFQYQGELTREDKLRFLPQLDVFSTPAIYHEPKGLSVLEAMASGVPVVLPRHGAFPEMIRKTGGGLLCDPENAASVADAIHSIYRDPALGRRLGDAGAAGVREHYSVARSAANTVEVFQKCVSHSYSF
jgi:glycosyltransferase involved in cell wall biosynthesis